MLKPNDRPQREPLLAMPQLKLRGWTPALVRSFLGPPDSTRTNPYYKSSPPMRLYAESRVLACEELSSWQIAASKSASRSAIGKAVAEKQATKLVAQSERLPITVIRLPIPVVIRRAVASYNAYHEGLYYERGYEYDPASEQSDSAFLERITVNFIRHELTQYDASLEEVAGRIGVDMAAKVIQGRVYAEIAQVYPEYAEEVKRQIRYRNGELA